MKGTTQTYTTVKISDLVIHGAVPKPLKDAFASVAYSLGHTAITPIGIHELTISHPPLAIINAQGETACIAGLRTLQLARTYLPHDTFISVRVCNKFSHVEIRALAIRDTYLTLLAFSLQRHTWPLDIQKIWLLMEKEEIKQYTPRLTTKTKLSKLMKISRQRLSPKFKKVTSKLKQIGK